MLRARSIAWVCVLGFAGCSAAPAPEAPREVGPSTLASAEAPKEPPRVDAAREVEATPQPADTRSCTPIPGLTRLSIVGGRPVGVTAEGLWALDVAGARPDPGGEGWPLQAAGTSQVDARGDSLEGAVLLSTDASGTAGAARKNEVHRRRSGAWSRALAPGGATYVDVAAAGPHVVAIASSRSNRPTLVSLGSEGDARSPRRTFVPSEPPASACAPRGPADVEVSPTGLVAVARLGCESRREWLEIFEPTAGSRGYVPVTEPKGSWVALAWLGGGALLGVVEIPGEPRPRRALHRIDALASTPVGGQLLDATSTLSPGAGGTVLVTTELGHFVVDATGAPSEVQPWPPSLGVRALGTRRVSRVAVGQDGALFVEVTDDATSVVRCHSSP